MRRPIAIIAAVAFGLALSGGRPVQAAPLAERLAGLILLQVEQHGEAWYVDPVDRQRRYLGRPADAFEVMRSRGLGVAHQELLGYLASGFPSRLSGRIMLDVEAHGEAYYVYPNDLAGRYLGRPADAFEVMRGLGLGITDSDLATIPATGALPTAEEPAVAASPAESALYEYRTAHTVNGDFSYHLVTLPRTAYRAVSLTASTNDCFNDCPTKSLADYVAAAGAVAGINGSYFCPPDYASCAGQVGSYLWPVYDSPSRVMTNEVNLKFHERTLAATDDQGRPSLYRNAKNEFGWSVSQWQAATGRTLAAAIGNYPALVYGGTVVVEEEPTLDQAMRTVKGRRGAWGWNDTDHFLVVAEQATVIDLAYVMQAAGAQFAINLDGGGSSALWSDGQYRVGPGRLLPNALVFVAK